MQVRNWSIFGLGVLVLLGSAQGAQAEWVSLNGTKKVSAPVIRSSAKAGQVVIDVEVPGLDITPSEGYLSVKLAGQAISLEKGAPTLPQLATSVAIPERGTPAVKLEVLEEATVPVAGKVIPGRGHVTRDVPLSSIPLVEGEAYRQAGFVPATFSATVDTPYIVRDLRGTTVRVAPVLYNATAKQLRVIKRARLTVEIAQGLTSTNEKTARAGELSGAFVPLYKSLFVNYEQATASMGAPSENTGRSLIVAADQFAEAVQPLVDWHNAKGLQATLVKTSQYAGTAENGTPIVPTAAKTKEFLAGEYAKGNLSFVLLVGDADTIPTLKGDNERADADASLVMLEGDDHVPDAFISRFSAKNNDEVAVQVARVLAYEKSPVTGEAGAFYAKATGIASAEGNPADYERADWLREAMMGYHFTSVDQIYDPGANVAKVKAALEEGRGLINYIGHGSKTSWVTSRFGNKNVLETQNTAGKWPMIWSVACVNGDFVVGADCFGEAWAKAGTAADPRGAIGIVAASTNMSWVPPCDWQSAIIKEFTIKELAWTGGALHLYGLVKAMEQWGTDADSEGVKMVEQCIYFGDSSVQIRNNIPAEATVTIESVRGREMTVKVVSGDKPVKGARVVVRAGDLDAAIGVTDDAGAANMAFVAGPDPIAEAKVTVTGPNLVPVLDQTLAVPQPPPADPPADGDGK